MPLGQSGWGVGRRTEGAQCKIFLLGSRDQVSRNIGELLDERCVSKSRNGSPLQAVDVAEVESSEEERVTGVVGLCER